MLQLIFRAMVLAVSVSLPGLAIAAIAGKQLLSMVFTPAYAAYTDVFLILMIGGIADGIGNVLGTAASSMRRFAFQAPIHFAKLAITYGGCFWGYAQSLD